MHSPGINGGELRGQLANPGSPGKKAIKTECVCVLYGDQVPRILIILHFNAITFLVSYPHIYL